MFLTCLSNLTSLQPLILDERQRRGVNFRFARLELFAKGEKGFRARMSQNYFDGETRRQNPFGLSERKKEKMLTAATINLSIS
jgi:hypothetical protein